MLSVYIHVIILDLSGKNIKKEKPKNLKFKVILLDN